MSHLSKTTATVMSLTALSVALGIMRDSVIAAMFGTSSQSDAFFAAFVLLNILYQVVVSGGLVPAFLPVFSGYLANGRSNDAMTVASSSLNILAVILTIVAMLLALGAESVVSIIAPGFPAATSAQTVLLLRIFSPGIVFMGLAGLIGAELNSLDHFFAPALSTSFISVGILVSAVLIGGQWGIWGLAIGALLGMFGQLVFQIPFVARDVKYRFVFDYRHPGIRRIAQLALPLLGYLVIAQTPTIFERIFASNLPSGTVSLLSYAQKVVSFPNLLITSSVLVALFPALARSFSQGHADQFREELWRGIRLISFLVVPSIILLILASQAIVEVLYQRGQFMVQDAQVTSQLVDIYAVGIFPTAMGVAFVRAFYATQNMKTPVWIGILNTVIYVCLASIFSRMWGSAGLAWSLSVSATISMMMLGGQLHRRTRFFQWKTVLFPILKITAAALLSGITYFVLISVISFGGSPLPTLTKVVGLFISLITAGAVYLLVCVQLDVDPARQYGRAIVLGVKRLALRYT